MIGLLSYEWLRLCSLRSTWYLAGTSIVAACLVSWGFSIVLTDAATGPIDPAEAAIVLLTRSPLTLLVPAILGVLAAAADHRYGLALVTQSVEPRRGRAPLARALVVGTCSSALVALCLAAAGVVTTVTMGNQADMTSVLPQLAVFALLGGGWAAIGVCVGTLVRAQGLGIALIVLWPLTLEPLVRLLTGALRIDLLDTLVQLLPSAAGEAAIRTGSTTSGGLLRASEGMPAPWLAGSAFAGTVLVALTVAATVNERRDAIL